MSGNRWRFDLWIVVLVEGVSGALVSGDAFFLTEPHTLFSGGKVAKITLAAKRFFNEEDGAALAEYGILVAFIAIVAITAVTFFGSKISAKFSALGNSFS